MKEMNGNLPTIVSDYLAVGSQEGQRNFTLFKAACQLRDCGFSMSDSTNVLENRAMQDGLEPHEFTKTMQSVFTRSARESATKKRGIVVKFKKMNLPAGISNPIPKLLGAAFDDGEKVRIVVGPNISTGYIRERDNLNGCSERLESTDAGAWICINPIDGGIKDANVTAYRHCLVEFDEGDVGDQYKKIISTNLPITAIIYSGGKSVHAWVRIDARDRKQYDERVAKVYEEFPGLDTQNKNPGRLSRLPGVKREGKVQRLLKLNHGADSWESYQESVQCKNLGQAFSFNQLLSFDSAADPNNVLGDRWLCRGHFGMIVGASGLGKSSLIMQASILWSLGKSAFGVDPVRPLKIVLVQAENDMGDLSEEVQGIVKKLGLDEKQLETVNRNCRFITDPNNVGQKFIDMATGVLEVYEPDLFIMDPLLHYIGTDVRSQQAVSEFVRHGIGGLAKHFGTTFIAMHHTGKPPTEKNARSNWSDRDLSYLATGSSDLVNFARAVAVLREQYGCFELNFTKRGERVKEKTIYLKHADDCIFWEPTKIYA
jgi:RecA-family ATPase